ncbi:hypothetical protein ACOCEA_11890 [Maribacter sp. CXY002]|uniref:hypothetical protein n=1 Tax=Maribacter luteocoastalis TaxID=3407671 RepID=UPI003B672618
MKNLVLLLLLVGFITNCSKDNTDPPQVNTPDTDTNTPPNDDPPTDVATSVTLVSDTALGTILGDEDGKPLYFFSLDAKGESNCNDGCLDVWPIFYKENLTVADNLAESDFGVITRNDGSMQNTYKGWPLYYFANDTGDGTVNGDGVNNIWYVAKPDYTIMMVLSQLVGRDSGGNETNLNSNYEPGDETTFYMVDDKGNTLYRFKNDRFQENNFTNEDFSNNSVWPIFEETLKTVPSILNVEDFGSIEIFGRQQLTYKGWPLYHFVQDEKRGDNYGVGFPAAGIWPIANNETEEATQPENATVSYDVTATNATAYIFNGNGLTNSSNPNLTLKRGNTYVFNVQTPGHPFLIKTDQSIGTDNTYDSGVTNNGASTGNITIVVPNDAPNVLYYVCELHSPMTGTFNITD